MELQALRADLLEELDVAASEKLVTARAFVRLAFVDSRKRRSFGCVDSLSTQNAHKDGDRRRVQSERGRLGRVVHLLPPQLVLDLVPNKLERSPHELRPVHLELTREPLLEVEVLASARKRRQVEREDERTEFEDLVEGFEVLSNVDDAGHVHLGFGVKVAQSGKEEVAVDLVQTEEDELVRRVTGQERREQAGDELRVDRVPRFLLTGGGVSLFSSKSPREKKRAGGNAPRPESEQSRPAQGSPCNPYRATRARAPPLLHSHLPGSPLHRG